MTAPASLNDAQMRAVHHVHGPCLVLAGAGSGKTRVIVHKMARLLQSGLAPAQIAAITFTNKAAQEMRARAQDLVGARTARSLIVSTFHSLGVRLLREDGERVGLKPRFSILDADDVLGVLRDAGGCSDNATARPWQWTISLWKNQGLDADAAERQAADDHQRQAARVMRRYQERLQAYQAVDFDDLILLPRLLLQRDAEVRARWQARLAHILVDEYQDTNAVQYDLLRLLAGERADFTAVGDDDQSIYGWRGATLDNLRRLPQDYPQLTVIALQQNYRSTGHILRAANAVISHNPKLFDKTLWSELGEGEPVRLLDSDHEEHEADRVVAWIQSLRASPSATEAARQWSDFAVLYRANHQAKVLEQKLRAAQIPYRVSGGQSYFDRTEIKDLCAWLRLIVNLDDDPAFLRAVQTPRRGIGHQTLGTLSTFAGLWKTSLFGALMAPSLGSMMKDRAVDALHGFGRTVNDLQQAAERTRGSAAARSLLQGWLADLGYHQHLIDTADSPQLAASRWEQVQDFVDWIARRCGADDPADAGSDGGSVLEVAQTIALILSLAEREESPDAVTLSTLHAAKGLEWAHVALVGVNEGLMPFRSSAEADEELTPERLQEERRLMYVGITRARRTLAVSHLRRRRKGRERIAALPSRFIGEMRLHEARSQEDPRERLKRLRDALAARAAATPTGGS